MCVCVCVSTSTFTCTVTMYNVCVCVYRVVCREGDTYGYHFNTSALNAHLNTMAGKKTAPFYNMQIIKYEVCILFLEWAFP